MGFLNNVINSFKIGEGPDDDEYEVYDEDEDYVEEPQTEKEPEENRFFKTEKKAAKAYNGRNTMSDSSSVCVFKPKSFEEAKEIVETFLENRTIVMNFEGVDLTISQRVLDIVTGACMAKKGNLQKISNFIFIATPACVDVSGEFQDSLTGAFDAL